MVPDGEVGSALGWLRQVATARAEQVVPVPGGVGLLHGGFPAAHDHNRLLLWSSVDASAAAAAADAVLGGAGLRHRLVDVYGDELADSLDAGLSRRGYGRSDSLLMVHRGADAQQAEAVVAQVAGVHVDVLDAAERARVAAAGWQDEHPEWPLGMTAQLGERIRTVLTAVDATFLAVRDLDGRPVARTDLYLRDGIAQVEEVVTEPAARGRGLARALVGEAVRRARSRGAHLVFLLADADDWPAELYRRLGFADRARTASFSR